jgi:hypothetical protein
VSPRKRAAPLMSTSSPRRLLFSPRKMAIMDSPTSHLPNLVLDGDRATAASSSSKKRQPLNWLTTLSRQKKSIREQSPTTKRPPISDTSSPSPRTVRAKRKLN